MRFGQNEPGDAVIKRRIVQLTPVILFATLGATFVSGFATAQVMYVPTPPPAVVADSADWYRAGEPIPFADAVYYPAGAIQHFDGNRMVRSGEYRGVPLYTDKFLDLYGKIFVPLSGGRLQPYERRREGPLAGTTGSQAPSFPVGSSAEAARETVVGPVVTVFDAEDREQALRPGAVGTAGAPGTAVAPPSAGMSSLMKPTGLNAVFITYRGTRWRPAGQPVAFDEARFRAVEDYQGFPVFVTREEPAESKAGVVYLPSRAGMLTPYEPIAASAPRPSPDRPQPRQP
jgi:hypothetical protein